MTARFVHAFLLAVSCSITTATFHLPFFPRPFPFIRPFPMPMHFGGFGGGPGFLRPMMPHVGGYGFGGSVGVGVGGGVGVGAATIGGSVDGDVNIIGGASAGLSLIGGATVPASRVMSYADGVDYSSPDISDTYVIG